MTPDFNTLGLSPFGISSFVKSETVNLADDWTADVGVVGVPFDQGASFRSGTRFGPKMIRDWSVRFSMLGADPPGYFDLRTDTRRAVCKIVDCGDVDILPLLWEDNFDRMTAAVKGILDHEALPVILGGDHAITFPLVRAFEGRGPITVVHFDAHLDYRNETFGLRYGHGHVLRRVSELDVVDKIVSIGIRSIRHQKDDVDAHRNDGNVMICAWDVHAHGVDHYRDQLPSGKDVYITFDIDGMDASLAPGTGTPEVGGLAYEEARRFLEIVCADNRLVGFDMVEVNPLYDPTQITALLANQLMVETLGFTFPGN